MKTSRWFILGAYAYSALHILAWWVFLNSSGNEAWAPAFKTVFGIVFLPIGLPTFGLCYLVWGSLDLFKTRFLLGPMADVAIASVASASILLVLLAVPKRAYLRLVRRGAAV